MKKVIAITLLAALLLGCSDPRDTVITEENRQTVFKEAQAKLTPEESQSLMAYIFRAGLSTAFGGEKIETAINGKTVRQLIAEQEAWEKQRAEEEARKKAAAEEARLRAEATANHLRQVVDLRVLKKQYRRADIFAGSYQDKLVFTFEATNNTGKQLRAFSGQVRFSDLFGKEIYTAGIQSSTPIPGNKILKFEQALDFNAFFDNQQRLRNEKLSDMQTEWIPAAVIFADGTRIGEAEE